MREFVKATLLWANLIGLIFLIGTGAYVYAHDDSYLLYPNQPFATLQPSVVAGNSIPLKIDRCNSDQTAHVYTFSSRLVNDDDPQAPVINLPGNAAIRLEPGCRTETSEANRVPISTPPGNYHLEGLADIRTRFHSYLVPWSSKTFIVLAPKEAK